MAIRVFLAEDHRMFRQAIHLALTANGMFQVIGEAGTGMDALAAVKELKPDVCVIDIGMPRLNGLEATEKIRAELPKTPVIILSQYADQERIVQALRAGAHGYVIKDAALEELVLAIKAVCNGSWYLSPAVLKPVIDGYLEWAEAHGDSPLYELTPRERQVLQFVAEGMSNQDIADELDLKTRTIESHRQKMMKKLDLHSTADLTRFAIRYGVISVED